MVQESHTESPARAPKVTCSQLPNPHWGISAADIP